MTVTCSALRGAACPAAFRPIPPAHGERARPSRRDSPTGRLPPPWLPPPPASAGPHSAACSTTRMSSSSGSSSGSGNKRMRPAHVNINQPGPRPRPAPPGAPRLAADAHPRASAVPLALRQQALAQLYSELLALYGSIGKHAPLAPVAKRLAHDDALAQEKETFRLSPSSRAGYTTASHTALLAVTRRDRAALEAAAEEALSVLSSSHSEQEGSGESTREDAPTTRARRILESCTETGAQNAVRMKRAAAARAKRGRINAAALREAYYVCPISLLPRWRYLTSIPSEWGPGDSTPDSEGDIKTCDRCAKSFPVLSLDAAATADDSDGTNAYPPCRFHHGRKRPDAAVGRQRRVWRWTCCGVELTPTGSNHESAGDLFCCSARLHVFREEEPEALHQRQAFIETTNVLPPAAERTDAHDVLSLDCELCYTTAGKSLTQLAIISSEGQTIANWLVQPYAKMIDYNTRFSGLSAETFRDAGEQNREVVTFTEARERLLALMHRETILVGHGLENDLSALRIVHPHIVDTAMLFPHPRGPPLRQSLRDLVAQHLGRLIQVDTTAGHDAMEDALAPLHLVQAKLAARDESGAVMVRGDAKGVERLSPFDPSNKATRSSPFFSVQAHLAEMQRQPTANTVGSSGGGSTGEPAPRLNAMALMRSSTRGAPSAASKRSRAAVFAPRK